jgi:hypothetical protein
MINEWENEPDYLRFTEDTTGWECIIKRTKALGILCGYVIIPKESILYNKHYNDELFNNIKVHGGLTFSDYEENVDDRDGTIFLEYLIGFDCAHLDDLAPYKQDIYQGIYRNIGYVEYECLRLARQLYELSNTKSNTDDNIMRETKDYAKECLIAMELGIDFKRYEMNELHDIIINKIKFITNKLKKLEK